MSRILRISIGVISVSATSVAAGSRAVRPTRWDVILGSGRDVVVDDVTYVVDVKAARGDVGRDQESNPRASEAL